MANPLKILVWRTSGKSQKERYAKRIPPGSSKDIKKVKSDPDGDLIGWLQTIKYAKENEKPIILVFKRQRLVSYAQWQNQRTVSGTFAGNVR